MNPNDPNAKAFNPRNARNPDEGVAYVIATGAPRHYVSGHGLVGGGALVRQRASITPGPTMLRLSEEQYQQALADPAFAKQLADKAAVQMRDKRDKRGKAGAKPAEGPTVEELRAAQDAAAAAEAAKAVAEAEAERLRTELAAAEAAREAAEKAAAGAAPPPAPAPAPEGQKPADGGGGAKSK